MFVFWDFCDFQNTWLFFSVSHRENEMTQDNKFHPAVEMFKTEYENGEMSRREFMARATTLGVTATGAYGLLGVAQPAYAGGHMKSGGTLRMQMEVRAL